MSVTTLPPATGDVRTSTPVQAPLATETTQGTVLHSQELLQGRNTIVIEHNGAVYRLQTTRQGKLILTK